MKKISEFPHVADVAALKALSVGSATEDQQKRALDFIINRISCVGGSSFDKDPATYGFNEGKRQVGLNITRLLSTPIERFKPKKKD